jgi:hypothetical protein
MTAVVWTITQPIAGVQQPNAASSVQQHPIGSRMNAVSAGVEWRFIYGQAAATLAADAAATYTPATGQITAGTAAPIDGNVLVAVTSGQYVWLKILNEV